MTVDDRIDELAAALASVDLALPAPAAGDVPWQDIDSELAPLVVPPALRRLWERVDVARMPISTYPPPNQPQFTLESWRLLRDEPAPFPSGLFPWCYESWNHLLIELDAPGASVGTLFEWSFGSEVICLTYHDLGDWLAVAAGLVREGAFERREGRDGDWLDLDTDRAREAATARLTVRGPHPVYGTRTEFDLLPGGWPGHWRAVAAIAHRDPPPRFPERTVAEVLTGRRDGPVTATVTGFIRSLDASTAGSRVLLWDETGRLDVWCPREIRGHGQLSGSPPFRIEVEVEPWTGPAPPVDTWPFGDPIPPGAVRFDYASLLAHLRPQATAKIVRRT